MKKTWQAPQLIILVRSKPEEGILLFCKSTAVSGGSPTVHDFACDLVDDCFGCNGITTS
jgi:hypothetical protein